MKTELEWEAKVRDTDVCMGQNPVEVSLPFRLSMPQAKLLCEKYRGKMITVESAEMQKRLFLHLAGILGDSGARFT